MIAAERSVRVLVADDSELFRELLSRVVVEDRALELVAVARDGDEAARLAGQHRPDVITMDLNMPDADGYAGIARIMAETPTPILVLTADPTEAAGFQALSLGALDIQAKPRAEEDLGAFGRELRGRLRLLAGVKVIRHPRGLRQRAKPAPRVAEPPEVIVVGASLGGPRALSTILKRLPATFPAPIAVVQHIADGFTEGLAGWLDQECALTVAEAVDGEPLRAGRVVLAPSGRHLVLAPGGVVHLSDDAPVDTFRPSVSPLFASAARNYGRRACGVLLTGMGRDGADGLKVIHDKGGTTIVQDEATSAVFGMPRAAIDLGAAERVLALEEIPRVLQELVR